MGVGAASRCRRAFRAAAARALGARSRSDARETRWLGTGWLAGVARVAKYSRALGCAARN